MTARAVAAVVGVGLVAVSLIVACAALPPPPPSAAPPTASAVPAAAIGAQLTVTGSGPIECMIPHGCLPSFLVQPANWDPAPDWEPLPDDPHFDVMFDGGMRFVSGEVIGAPQTLAPGRYRLAIALSEVSDLSSMAPDGRTVFPFMWTEVRCTRDIAVEEETNHVNVEAFFGDPCRIDVSQGP